MEHGAPVVTVAADVVQNDSLVPASPPGRALWDSAPAINSPAAAHA
jgi:hypothetical protein